MKTTLVRIEQLWHRYTKQWAIQDINFQIEHHGVLGLLGSNGAGKSTTMNIMCGVLNQTRGRVLIDGIDLRKKPEEAKKLIGFLPQQAPLHLDLTVDEYLRHCAHLRLVPSSKIPAAMESAKQKCGIAHFSKRLIRNLSGGYRQRVGIAQAIIHEPRLVVLDEPTNGLDPNQILEVRKLIREIGEERSVILSSHILSEIQATCQGIRMIEHGKLVFDGTMEAFNNYVEPSTLLVTLEQPPLLEELRQVPAITRVELLHRGHYRLYFSEGREITQRVIQYSLDKGWGLSEISLEKTSLEEVFAQLSKKN